MAHKQTKPLVEGPAGPEPRWFVDFFVRHTFFVAVVLAAIGLFLATGGDGLRKIFGLGLGIAIAYGAQRLIRLRFPEEYEEADRRRRATREAKLLVSDCRRILRKRKYRLEPGIVAEVGRGADALEEALRSHDFERLRPALATLDDLVDRHLAFARKGAMREYTESIGVAVLIALLLRSFVVEAFKIPSGSMIPTLRVGDHIFVSKFIYGLGNPLSGIKFWSYHKPERGDVVVFKYPRDPDKDFIKRVIGVEGDMIRIDHEDVYVNGKKIPRELQGKVKYEDISDDTNPLHVEDKLAEEYRETVDGKKFSIFVDAGHDLEEADCDFGCSQPVQVPPGHVFVMGDNRDNSHDSRYWGFVEERLIKGKALFIWLSLDPTQDLIRGVRLRRFGLLVK